MIVVSGADCVGKTTLVAEIARQMAERHSVAMMPRHFTKPPACFDYYWGYKECVARHALIDRFHMDQVAYRKMDEGELLLTPHRYALIDGDIERVGGIVAVMYAPDFVIRQRWTKPEMYGIDQVLLVNEIFGDIIKTRHVMTKHGDYRMKVDVILDNYTLSVERSAELVCEAWYQRQAENERVVGLWERR